MKSLKMQMVASVVRSALLLAASALATRGYLGETTPSMAVDQILPAVLYVISLGWSYTEKRKTATTVQTLQQHART